MELHSGLEQSTGQRLRMMLAESSARLLRGKHGTNGRHVQSLAGCMGRQMGFYYEFVSRLKRPEVCSRALGPKIETPALAGRAAGLARASHGRVYAEHTEAWPVCLRG